MRHGPSAAPPGSRPRPPPAPARASAASGFGRSPAVAARHHAVFVEAALEGAVEEHGLARRVQADEARELRVAREDERVPSCEAFLQQVAELRIEGGEL